MLNKYALFTYNILGPVQIASNANQNLVHGPKSGAFILIFIFYERIRRTVIAGPFYY